MTQPQRLTQPDHPRQYALFTLPDGFALPEGDEAFETFALAAAERLDRGGIVPVIVPQGEGCTLIAFTHAGKKDRPVLAFDRTAARRYAITYPPCNSDLIFVDEPHRLVYLSPYHKACEGVLADILLTLCARDADLLREPLDLDAVRAFPRAMLRPAGRGYPWNHLGLLRLTVKGVGRNPPTTVRTWEADAFDALGDLDDLREGRIQAVSLTLWPTAADRVYVLDLAHGPHGGGRVRCRLDAVSLPVLGTLLRSGLLEARP